jgi:hypothetical protein
VKQETINRVIRLAHFIFSAKSKFYNFRAGCFVLIVAVINTLLDAALDPLELFASNLLTQSQHFKMRCITYSDSLRTQSSRRDLRSVHLTAYSALKLHMDAAILSSKSMALKSSIRVSRISLNASCGLLDICRSELRSYKSWHDSLSSIVQQEPSSIVVYELVLWMVSSRIHVEDSVGDFREIYEAKLASKGEECALDWARSQSFKELERVS